MQECLLAGTSKLEDKRKVTATINRLVAEALDTPRRHLHLPDSN